MTVHVLIGCSASKSAHACAALELYTGRLFRKSLRWALAHGGETWVLSALHGLVRGDSIVEPYDARLHPGYKLSDVRRRRTWTEMVARQALGWTADGDSIIALAPAAYCEWRDALVDAGRSVSMPLERLSIGHQLHQLNTEAELMERGWWDKEQVELNANILGMLRTIGLMELAIRSASSYRATEKARRDVAAARRNHERLIEAYKGLPPRVAELDAHCGPLFAEPAGVAP